MSWVTFAWERASDGVWAVRGRRSLGGRMDFASVSLPGGEDSTDPWAQWVATTRAVPARVRLTIAPFPSDRAVVRRISIPLSSERRAKRVVGSLLDVHLPFRLEDAVWRAVEFGRTEQSELFALCVATPRSVVEGVLSEWRATGMDPVILDPESLALWHGAWHEVGPVEPSTRRIVVHATPDRWVAAVGDRYGLRSVSVLREVPGDAAAWRERLRSWWATLRAAGRVPLEWVWSGHPATQLSRWRCELEEEWSSIGMVARSSEVAAPEWFLPRALARRALDGTAWEANLRDADLAQAEWAAARRRDLAVTSAATVLVAAIWGGVVGWDFARVRALELQLNAEIAAEARRIGQLSRVVPGQEVRQAREAVRERLARWQPLDRLFQPSQLANLSGVLRQAGGSQLTLYAVELSDDRVRIEGSGPDRDGVQQLAGLLQLLGFRVRVETSPPVAGHEGVSFVVEGARG